MDWAQILVIILSLLLAIFLLMAIFLVGMLIKVTRQIKRVTESAERTAGRIEHVVARFGSVKLSAAAGRKIFDLIKKIRKK